MIRSRKELILIHRLTLSPIYQFEAISWYMSNTEWHNTCTYLYILIMKAKKNAKCKWLTTCLFFTTQKSYFYTLKCIILIQTSRNLAFHWTKHTFTIGQKQRQHHFEVVLRSITTFMMMATLGSWFTVMKEASCQTNIDPLLA